jgi:hypothetical protein
MGWQAVLEEAVRNKLDLMSTPANKRAGRRTRLYISGASLWISSIRQRTAPRRSRCASRHAGLMPPGYTLTLTTWRARNRHALREFWVRAPADALGVKQELEKALAQDGKPTT